MAALPSISVPKRSKLAHPVRVRTPFDEAFIAELKARVPASARKWDAGEHCWRVAAAFRAEAEEAMLARWPEIQVLGDPDDGDHIRTRSGEIIAQHGLFE